MDGSIGILHLLKEVGSVKQKLDVNQIIKLNSEFS